MTREDFARGYAERSGMTVEQLRELGLEARPCSCGEAGCQGWKMQHVREDRWFREQGFDPETGSPLASAGPALVPGSDGDPGEAPDSLAWQGSSEARAGDS